MEQYKHIPASLKQLNQWVCFKLVYNEKKGNMIRYRRTQRPAIMQRRTTRRRGATSNGGYGRQQIRL